MEERNEMDKVDDVMLPGFRFHPTDEELVGFYLKSKVQNRSLPIELIKQVDIYKYDPWDLPKLATTEEKEWYFYCQRDRKYRNSTRPNRVTGAGFWKATGTDRPIYSSDTTKCIGLKKSLVFYRGRAAKGIKTDWMMHEFRLPSSTSDSSQPNKLFVKSLPLNDSWAICRIFKKTNSMAQRALSHSWVPGLPEIAASDHMITQGPNYPQFSTIEVGPDIQFCTSGHLQLQNTTASYDNKSPTFPFSNEENFNGFVYSPPVLSGTTKSIVDQTFMLLNPSMMGNMGNKSDFGSPEQQLGAFSMSLPQVIIPEDDAGLEKIPRTSQDNNQSKAIRSIGFPFSLSADDWKPVFPWDSPSCPSEMSTSISTNSCYS